MKCPVCKIARTVQQQLVYGKPLVTVPDSLYQKSYPGEPEYISPRCLQCFNKALREQKTRKKEEPK